jgi:hypothetical protein
MQVNVPTVEMQYHSVVFSARQNLILHRQHNSILVGVHSVEHEACLVIFRL